MSSNTKHLKVIVESGSTKSDFVILTTSGDIINRFQISGFNPLFNTVEEKFENLDSIPELKNIAPNIDEMIFYGAGCSTDGLKNKVKLAFSSYFVNAICHVYSDMMAACQSVYANKPCLVGILGTGSNICYYDGNQIHKVTPSLGYILGDEGSGNHLGRLLLRAYFNKQLPHKLAVKFENEYHLVISEVLENVYGQPKPNAYLANFNRFIYDNRGEDFLQALIQKSFEEFYHYQMIPYLQLNYEEINFVGSIAHLYRSELDKMANKYNFKIGRIIQSPIEELIRLERKDLH